MSIEELIQENIAATKANTEALIALAAKIGVSLSTDQVKEADAPKATRKSGAKGASEPQPVVTSTPATLATPSSPSTPASAAAPATTATAGVDYEAVKDITLKLSAAKGRDVVVGLMQQFGVTKAPELKPEQYAAYLKNAKGLLEAADEALV
jgi:hypothetical protein